MIRGILEVARRGATKTEIVYRSNLNFKIVDQCLSGLLKAGYVVVEAGHDGKAEFHTTEKGFSFLLELTRLGKAIAELLEPNEGPGEQVTQGLAPSRKNF